MTLIGKVVQQVIASGYLSLQTEDQLRQMFENHCDLEDLDAFMRLQEAARVGRIRRESRELMAINVSQGN